MFELDKVDAGQGRRAARARRRAAAVGRVSRALGQQVGESAACLPVTGRLERGRALRDSRSCCCRTSARRSGRRKSISTPGEAARIWEDRATCRVSMRGAAVRRRDLRPSAHLGSGPALPRRHADAALRSATDRSFAARAFRSDAVGCSAAAARSPSGCACSRPSRAQITDGPPCPPATSRSYVRAIAAPGVHGFARARDRLEMKDVVVDLDQHEVVIRRRRRAR